MQKIHLVNALLQQCLSAQWSRNPENPINPLNSKNPIKNHAKDPSGKCFIAMLECTVE